MKQQEPLGQQMQHIKNSDTGSMAFIINELKRTGYSQEQIDNIIAWHVNKDKPGFIDNLKAGWNQHTEDVGNVVYTGYDKLRRAYNALLK